MGAPLFFFFFCCMLTVPVHASLQMKCCLHLKRCLYLLSQAHVQGAMSGPHHSGNHGQPQLVMLQPPPQQGPGSVPQHPQHGPQQGAHQHFYIGHPQGTRRRKPSHDPLCGSKRSIYSVCRLLFPSQQCRYKRTLLPSISLETKPHLPSSPPPKLFLGMSPNIPATCWMLAQTERDS